jgi:hypothetical protein
MYCYIDSNNRMLSKQCSTTAASKLEDEYDHISENPLQMVFIVLREP